VKNSDYCKPAVELIRRKAVECQEAGCPITLTFPVSWIAPPGFPHGELLSASGEGNNYSFDPDLILAWIDSLPTSEET
jgi:hypothetical protein